MSDQCNFCGTFDETSGCSHCPTQACKRCKLNHEPFCKEIQKAKGRGEGPTVANVRAPEHRSGHATPPTTEPDQRGRLRIPVAALTTDAVPKYDEGIAHLDAPVDDADQGLQAVKDLLADGQ